MFRWTLEIKFLLMVESAYREEECPCPSTRFSTRRPSNGYQAKLAKYLGRAISIQRKILLNHESLWNENILKGLLDSPDAPWSRPIYHTNG